MASPFTVFRKNQKVMLAVIGVAAMIAFVFLGPLSQYMGSGRGQGENPVVVETSYGDLKETELDALEYQRQLVDRFIQAVVAQSVGKQFGQPGMDTRWLNSIGQQQYMMWRNRIMGRAAPGPEQQAVETMILAERAKQMGLVISDQTINDTIQQLSANTLTAAELQEIIRNLQPQRPISVAKLFEALRTELLASQYVQFFANSLTDLPPAQRFEYFSRLNRQAKVELLPLSVAEFVNQTPEPTDAEVKALYEKYKNVYPDPTSPDPGFRKAKRATFQYFKASIEPVAEQLKDDVTDEEIAKFYEENKQRFPAMSLDDSAAPAGDTPAAGTDAATADDKPSEDMPTEEKPAEEKPAEENPAEEKPAEEKPATEEAPAEDVPAEDAPAEEKPAEEKPAEETPDDEAPAEEPEASEGNKPAQAETPAEPESPQAQAARKSVFRLVSLQEEGEAPSEEPSGEEPAGPSLEAPATDAEAEPAAEQPADEKPADEKPADEAPTEEMPAEEKPAEAPAAEEKPTEEEPAEETPADTKPAGPGDEVVPEPAVPDAPQFEPLEKVSEEIREILAQQKAAERLQGQFDELSAAMRRYADDYDVYSVERQTNPKAVAPAPLDFAKLAEGKNVEVGELKSVTPLQAAKSDIGRSFRQVEGAVPGQGRQVPFIQFAFADSLPEFKPEMDQDGENNYYLFWKTEDEPAYVPPLDEIRDEVVRAWRMDKARDLAKKRAEEYAEQARTQKKPLAELFGSLPDTKVVEAGPFTWLTLGNVPMQQGATPRLSEVEGVDQAGPDFMRAVFNLTAGELGVAFNQPRDVVYVIRATEFSPSEEQLRDEFARETPNRYLAAALEDQRAIYRDWLEELQAEADVNWLRQADMRRASAADLDGEF